MEVLFSGILMQWILFYQICVIAVETNDIINDNPVDKFEVLHDRNSYLPAQYTGNAYKQEVYGQTAVNQPVEVRNNPQVLQTDEKAFHAPYQAHIKFNTYKGNIFMCCAVIVGPRTLLSSAYCFDPTRYGFQKSFPKEDLLEISRAVAGVTGADNEEMGQWRSFIQIVGSDRYVREPNRIKDDIAILFIEGTWDFNDVVKSIHILSRDDDLTKRKCEIAILKIAGEVGYTNDNLKLTIMSPENRFYYSGVANKYVDPKGNLTLNSTMEKYNYSEVNATTAKKEVKPTKLPVGKTQVLSKVSLLTTRACKAHKKQKGIQANSSQILCVASVGNESIYREYAGGPLVCHYPEYEETSELGLLVGILSQEGATRKSRSLFTKTASHADWIKNIQSIARLDRAIPINKTNPYDDFDDLSKTNRIAGYQANVLVSTLFLYVFSCANF